MLENCVQKKQRKNIKIHKKSKQNPLKIRCEIDARKKEAQNRKDAPKVSQNESRNRENIDKNGGSKKYGFLVHRPGHKTLAPGSTVAILGGPF